MSIFCENQAALCYFEMPDPNFEMAKDHMKRAIELISGISKPNELLLANFAVIEYACGDKLSAHKAFQTIYEKTPKYELDSVYVPIRAMAAYSQYQKDITSFASPELLLLLKRAIEAPRIPNLRITDSELKDAIDDISKST